LIHALFAARRENIMPNWYCDSQCKISKGGAGSWKDDNKEFFQNIKSAHSKCTGFQRGEPKLRGKENWGNTEIENACSNSYFINLTELLHHLIAHEKGPDKCCLIPKKTKGKLLT
jgi:hypothetical protein